MSDAAYVVPTWRGQLDASTGLFVNNPAYKMMYPQKYEAVSRTPIPTGVVPVFPKSPINPSTAKGYYTGPRFLTPDFPSMAGESARQNTAVGTDTSFYSAKDFAELKLAEEAARRQAELDAMGQWDMGNLDGGGGGSGGGISRQQIADAINRMVEAARGAQKEINTAYGTAGSELDKLMQQYAASAQAQQQGAGQTLQAFGVDPAMLNVGGMSPTDLLVAQKANLAAQQAAQNAAMADRIAAYQTLLGA